MPVEIQEIGPCKKRIRVTVPKERVREELERNYHELGHTIALPGFRRGRVPRQLLEKRFGKSIEQEIEQSLIRKTLSEALEENRLQPLGEPRVERRQFDAAKDPALEYEATVAVRPEFDVPDLSGLRVEKPAVAVTDEEVAEALEASRRARGKLVPKPEGAAIAREDAILVDVEFLADGEPKRRDESALLWVRNDRVGPVAVENLAGKLAGKKVGDTVEIEAPFPPSLVVAGEKTVLRLTIREIREVFMPALDDAFARDSGFDDLKEMREEVRSRLLRAGDEAAERAVADRIVEMLLDRVSFDLPDEIVEEELDELALRVKIHASLQGKSDEEAAAEPGRVRTASRAEVVRRLKGIFLLDRIAREEKIFATEDEVAEAVARMAERSGRARAEVMQQLESSGAISRLRYELRMEKTKKFLRSRAEVIEVAGGERGRLT